MAEQVKKLNGLVNVTLTKRQAQWLYDHLAEVIDDGVPTFLDGQHCVEIGNTLDVELGKF